MWILLLELQQRPSDPEFLQLESCLSSSIVKTYLRQTLERANFLQDQENPGDVQIKSVWCTLVLGGEAQDAPLGLEISYGHRHGGTGSTPE